MNTDERKADGNLANADQRVKASDGKLSFAPAVNDVRIPVPL
jgi:hypothetical protein